ncbi:MAG TPA: DNA gyrase inhibitor YacG [Burkholderiales bacterium]|nr:DNA gyrase inhibitor YacG [Burkholderiales bacterium]
MKRSQAAKVQCPQCGKSVPWDESNRYRPFCSKRCKLIDLGEWAAESYRIPEHQKKNQQP